MERQTRQKQAVFEAIAGSGRSLNAYEIHALARAQVPTLNLSTVYRQLRGLAEAEQVDRVELPGQPPRFEARVQPAPTGARARGAHAHRHAHAAHHHHHFHCLRCDQVYPIEGCPGGLDALAPQGFRVERHDITLHGRCAACA
jgi:Fur family transcriptional regulator, ferric uptake regulator